MKYKEKRKQRDQQTKQENIMEKRGNKINK